MITSTPGKMPRRRSVQVGHHPPRQFSTILNLSSWWVASMSDQVGVGEGLPMGEVAFERYRLQSPIGQSGTGKMSPTAPSTSSSSRLRAGWRAVARICQDSKNSASRPAQPACRKGSRAATTQRKKHICHRVLLTKMFPNKRSRK
jgi:hypothetical protein